jgi:hypothetical protein
MILLEATAAADRLDVATFPASAERLVLRRHGPLPHLSLGWHQEDQRCRVASGGWRRKCHRSARDLKKDAPCELWDRNRLIARIPAFEENPAAGS